ncbi:hypothetical protein BAU25_01200 [Bacillus albus]|uniref:Uncharacterized protein n=1 Tax=Bacillus albus TaxID=2026189 RepID=A0A1J9UNC9_9BACI|nr:hypothetical protein BAU25_01200 [Bacillus albus]
MYTDRAYFIKNVVPSISRQEKYKNSIIQRIYKKLEQFRNISTGFLYVKDPVCIFKEYINAGN